MGYTDPDVQGYAPCLVFEYVEAAVMNFAHQVILAGISGNNFPALRISAEEDHCSAPPSAPVSSLFLRLPSGYHVVVAAISIAHLRLHPTTVWLAP